MSPFYFRKPKSGYSSSHRLHILSAIFLVFSVIIIGRLFYLQIIKHKDFVASAQAQHLEGVELRAKRGDILAVDYHSGRNVTLATNSTWYLLYVDPHIIDEPAQVAEFLTPHMFSAFCGERVDMRMTKELCVTNINKFLGLVETSMIPKPKQPITAPKPEPETPAPEIDLSEEPHPEDVAWDLGEDTATPVEDPMIAPEDTNEPLLSEEDDTPTVKRPPLPLDTSMEDLQKHLHAEVLKKVSQKETTFTQLKLTDDQELLAKVRSLNITGVHTTRSMVWANPTQVANPKLAAGQLSELLSLDVAYLERVLSPRPLRYVPLIRKLDPVIADKINETKGLDQRRFYNKEIPAALYRGVALNPESYRYYPEGTVASSIIGFVDHQQTGRYGIEEMFDKELRGISGKIVAESDPFGRQITVRKSIIEPPSDGDDIVLTIDRIIQAEAEKQLKEMVLNTKANAAQVVIMDPKTGGIIAMASYPGFDPNNFGDVYQMQPITFDPGRDIPLFVFNPDETLRAAKDEERSLPVERYVYQNRFGPGAYQNMNVSGLFEPGSIFKPIIMAAAIDAQEITPNTRYYDAGEIKVDTFTIRNAVNTCIGHHDMIHALNYSCNIGMIFVAQKMGQSLMYKYIQDFGFGDRTLIELAGEVKGKVDYYREWSDARFFNTSFGQGLTVTPLQMARAYAALANGGLLLQPTIIKEIRKDDGTVIEKKPVIVRQVISQEAANTITAMLTSSVEWGVARPGGVPDHSVAGKTGTSQTVYRGRYERGVGNTITSYAGYAPANNPKFVMVIKVDRPRTTEWAEGTAAPLFSRLTSFMLDYYNVPPNKQSSQKGY